MALRTMDLLPNSNASTNSTVDDKVLLDKLNALESHLKSKENTNSQQNQ